MIPRRAIPAVCLLALLTAGRAGAEVRCALAPDGTLHVANVASAPTGPSGAAAAPVAAGSGGAAPPERFGPRAAPYLAEIAGAAERHGLSPRLLAAVISVESNFDPRAVSAKGARGLMQLLPSTARLLGVADVFDHRQNIEAGARHLRALLDRFAGDPSLALAAYNAGEQAVIAHAGIPPYAETRRYVDRVRRLLGADDGTTGAHLPGHESPVTALAAPDRLYRGVAGDGTTVYSNRPRASGPTRPAVAMAAVEGDAASGALSAAASPEACRVASRRLDDFAAPDPDRD